MDCRTECIEIQEFDTVRDFPVGLARDTRLHSCKRLNQILADTQSLHALYKRHHWLMRGATFYQLHLLLDKHADQQNELIDKIAKRVQTLGGIAVGDPRHVAEFTKIRRAPNGCEEVPAMLSRLLEAHETILVDAHDAAAKIAELGDDGSNDLIVSERRVGSLVPGRTSGRYPAGARLSGRKATQCGAARPRLFLRRTANSAYTPISLPERRRDKIT
jgi:starvation-inducible DNA-binding protein